MKDDILKDIFDIETDPSYEFRELYGMTFAFKRTVIIFKDQVTSAEIRPAGIIYEENGQSYFAPLYETDDIEEIVKEFVKKMIK